MKFNTKLLHDVPSVDPLTGAASLPKYQVSTYHQEDIFNKQKYTYTRFGNPTVEALENGIATLENANFGLAFSSGMAAITTALMTLQAGDHVIAPKDIYGGAYQLIHDFLPNYGISSIFLEEMTAEEIGRNLKPNTKMIYIETPSNPLLKITDIREVVSIARKFQLKTVIDNTFMTPVGQTPLDLGVDMVIHSATKFINGHSDVVAGLIATNDEKIFSALKKRQITFGSILGPEDAWLVLRGLKTLGIRFERSAENAKKIAEFLATNKAVKKVYYPGLPTHEKSTVHFSQAQSGGAVLSFDLGSQQAIAVFCKNLTIPISAVSLGGVESILSYPATMSHACMSKQDRLAAGVTEGLVRLSVGIEDIGDLLDDLSNSLHQVEVMNIDE